MRCCHKHKRFVGWGVGGKPKKDKKRRMQERAGRASDGCADLTKFQPAPYRAPEQRPPVRGALPTSTPSTIGQKWPCPNAPEIVLSHKDCSRTMAVIATVAGGYC